MTILNKMLYGIVISSFLSFNAAHAVGKDSNIRNTSSYEKKNSRKIKAPLVVIDAVPILTSLEILDSTAPAIFEDGMPISLTFTQGQSVYAMVDTDVGPIVFSFLGQSHIENAAPFHMNGDNVYVSFSVGTHEIGIQTPDYNYSVFIDVDEPIVEEPIVEEPVVELLSGVPVLTELKILDELIPDIFEDATPLSLSFTQGQAVYVVVGADAGPLTFSWMGISHTENSAPFHMNGDNAYVSFPTGTHEIGIQTPDYNYSVFVDVGVDGPLEEDPVVQEVSVTSPESSDFNLYPRETTGWDESGWSIISPSEDSRLIYVSSSSGNDDTGEFVSSNSVVDIYYPAGVKPFRTIDAALSKTRTGFPDWVILKRGDTWDVSDILSVQAGRSVYERSVLTSYGAGTDRPIIKTRAKNGLRIWIDVNFVAIVGISLYAEFRDPESSEFAGWGQVGSPSGIYMYQSEDNIKRSILLENNDINYFATGVVMTGPGRLEDVVIRRNIIRNSYSEASHSQGVFANHASVLLEENVFDHNGWYKQQVGSGNDPEEGQATYFNHNTYFSGARYTRFVRNIFLRSSSIHNKWTANSDKDGAEDLIKSSDLWIGENVYVGGEVGISAGGNTDYNTGPRWRNATIKDNVMLAIGRDQPTNRNIGWYIEANDWETGLICGNYLLNNDNPDVNNLNGITLSGHSSNVTIAENTIHGLLRHESGRSAIKIDSDPKSNVMLLDNNIQLSGSKLKVIDAYDTSALTFQGNKYFSGAEPEIWFGVDGLDESFSSWVELTGDINSTVGKDEFSDPPRSFETYLLLIGASTSIGTFTELVASQSRSGWRQDLTAGAILRYIRDGYGGQECSQ